MRMLIKLHYSSLNASATFATGTLFITPLKHDGRVHVRMQTFVYWTVARSVFQTTAILLANVTRPKYGY
jgi:hypothetical protein